MPRTPARRGFTLLELLIVVAIAVVLSAITVPNTCGPRRNANQRACFANQKTIASAVEMYNLDHNANVGFLTPALRAELEELG